MQLQCYASRGLNFTFLLMMSVYVLYIHRTDLLKVVEVVEIVEVVGAHNSSP